MHGDVILIYRQTARSGTDHELFANGACTDTVSPSGIDVDVELSLVSHPDQTHLGIDTGLTS